MNRGLLYRILLVAGLVLAAVIVLLPSILSKPPGFLPDRQIRLGLDLQGGMHLVLSVGVDKAVENSVERLADQMRADLRDQGVRNVSAQRSGPLQITVSVPGEEHDTLADRVENYFSNLRKTGQESEGDRIVYHLEMTEDEARQIRELAVEQALEKIRNRVDQIGVTEPVIQRQGATDIVVQLPGIHDPDRARDIIGRTALLEFKLVREGVNPDAFLGEDAELLPPGTEILPLRRKDELGNRLPDDHIVVEKRTLMTGDVITDARVRPGELPGDRVVIVEFDGRGTRLFAELTGEHVGRRLAIILDGTVYSAPQIQERIPGGSARITGAFSFQEARDLAIVLRTGALPAPVDIAEERTVGPTLGADSIRQGLTSFLVGGVLVIVFMVIYYSLAGLLADMALILNVVFLLAALAALEATLTLPGIAGIVLTLGMAVDANVLISERIREEIRAGKTAGAAIGAGYDRALPAILDSNVTTFLAGVILFQFGSGPIKGFAVTLCIGLVTSVFTAVVGTRVVYDWLLATRRMKKVSI